MKNDDFRRKRVIFSAKRPQIWSKDISVFADIYEEKGQKYRKTRENAAKILQKSWKERENTGIRRLKSDGISL